MTQNGFSGGAMHVLVVGGTGFIGRHVVARLVAAGHFVHVPTRYYKNGRDLLVFPTVHLFEADVHDEAKLSQLLKECDAVINLAGILHSRAGDPYGPDFARIHVELPRRLAQLCRDRGIRRMLHVSALGAAPDAPSEYLRSKAAGEEALRKTFIGHDEGAWTIFRPSVVFGPQDRFMNRFADLARFLPVIPLASPQAKLQPIYVGDVASIIVSSLENPHQAGRVFPLAGLQVYELRELVRLAALWSGHPRRIIGLPASLGRMQARFFEMLPGEPVMSRDNLASLSADNTIEVPIAPELGLVPASLESIAPNYLARN